MCSFSFQYVFFSASPFSTDKEEEEDDDEEEQQKAAKSKVAHKKS